jgi:hypothetical protein
MGNSALWQYPLAGQPYILIVNPTLPVKNVKEDLVA